MFVGYLIASCLLILSITLSTLYLLTQPFHDLTICETSDWS